MKRRCKYNRKRTRRSSRRYRRNTGMKSAGALRHLAHKKMLETLRGAHGASKRVGNTLWAFAGTFPDAFAIDYLKKAKKQGYKVRKEDARINGRHVGFYVYIG